MHWLYFLTLFCFSVALNFREIICFCAYHTIQPLSSRVWVHFWGKKWLLTFSSCRCPVFAYPQTIFNSLFLHLYSSGSTSANCFSEYFLQLLLFEVFPRPPNLHPAHWWPFSPVNCACRNPHGCPHLTLGYRMRTSKYTCWITMLVLSLCQ